MVKRDIIALTQTATGLDFQTATHVVDEVFNALKQALVDGQQVKVHSFGTFLVRTKLARMGRNPKNKRPHPISARRVISFRAGDILRDAISRVSAP